MSLSWKESGAIIEHSVCPGRLWESTHPFTVFSTAHWRVWCSGVPAAVDAQYLTGDVAGFLGHQKGARRGNVFRPAHPAHRSPGDVLLDVAEEALRLGVAQHRSVDETRGHGVDRDAAGPVLERERLGESVDRGLSGHIVRHVRLAGMSARRRDIDDPSP